MHHYSTDSNEREKVLFGLAVMAIVAAWFLSRALQFAQVTVPWWLDAPSTMGFFGILYKVFDEHLWRIPILHRAGLLKVPLLAGHWHGYVVSSFDNHKKSRAVNVDIKQTWTHIAVLLSSDVSRSHTLTAAIQVHAPEGTALSYQYENQPEPEAIKSMEMHIGSARLILKDGCCLEGNYYSGRGRQEYGRLFLERIAN